ncbi:hypothetical protein BT63DRAFT_425609 [Microthyrium microscopicum]|uniref:DNA repair protein Rad26 n=1 Tax=Microthyrium microscopicum TaxID=703497 RepID=A0A6A6U7P9_9PEZI|nr:hypothetical protein BT63DRAFT_425609 [Microthyrium microscopicum]
MAENDSADDFDDEFDDDVLENLPPSTIQALENNIPQIRPPVLSRPNLSTTRKPPPAYPTFEPSDIQEEVINLDDYSRTGARPTYANLKYQPHAVQRPSPNPPQLAHRGSRHSSTPQPVPRQSQDLTQSNSLQAQIQRLQRENALLKQRADADLAKAQSKTGEVAILRQRIEKSAYEYEHKLQSIQQAHNESAARQKAQLEVHQKAREQAETDRRFLEHDIALESNKNRQTLKRPEPKSKPGSFGDNPFSPRKSLDVSFGDGFDDDQVPPSPSTHRVRQQRPKLHDDQDSFPLPVSPIKSRTGSKTGTPSRRAEKKRKRADQSPTGHRAMLLDNRLLDASPVQLFSPDHELEEYADHTFQVSIADHESDSVRSLLDYKISATGERFMDVMGKLYLPSMPSINLSTFILDKWSLSAIAGEDPTMRLCRIICKLWDQSIQEKYYNVIGPIIDILHFMTSKNGFSYARKLVSSILPPAMASVNVVAFPLASEKNESEIDEGLEDHENINTKACLNLLLSVAQSCQGSNEDVANFWSTMTLHWTLVLLYPTQPIHHHLSMCALLRTSALDDSFGPIFQSSEFDSVADQESLEQYLLDRLTSLLCLDPLESKLDRNLNLFDTLRFRIGVFKTIQAICSPPRNGVSVAKHPTAIGRIIQFLNSSIELLYTPQGLQPVAHNLVLECIKSGTRLLYIIVTTHSESIDLREKLKAVEGGDHMHLIALSRIAFCESIVLERGIEPAVGDAAHSLLDEFLSPIEGEQLLKMFPSSDGTAGHDRATHTGAEDETPEDVLETERALDGDHMDVS